MGVHAPNNQGNMSQFEAMMANAQNQQNASYQDQLKQEQDAFSKYLTQMTATQNQSLSQNPSFSTIPTGVALGALSPLSGSYLSPSGSRNTFLGG